MLEIDDNDLRTIDGEAFAGLEGLLYLKISKSSLTAVEDPSNYSMKSFNTCNCNIYQISVNYYCLFIHNF